jgi:hypothetical protein
MKNRSVFWNVPGTILYHCVCVLVTTMQVNRKYYSELSSVFQKCADRTSSI